jgi:RNA polymerase sigma-70 factor, ECF subfamily
MTAEPPVIFAMIERCLMGDQAGFGSLYEECAPSIYRLCYSLLMNRQDAEDVMQESFVYAFKNISRYDSERASFKTWLYTIALSRCRNNYRRQGWLRFCTLISSDLPAPRSETPEAKLAEEDAKAAVEGALLSLSPRLREAVVLRYGHGLTYREIAEVTRCPQKTAESRVRLAHERLRNALQPVGKHLLEEMMRFEL